MAKRDPSQPLQGKAGQTKQTDISSDHLLKSLAPVVLDETLSPSTAQADLGAASASAATMSLFFAFDRADARAFGNNDENVAYQKGSNDAGLKQASADVDETRLAPSSSDLSHAYDFEDGFLQDGQKSVGNSLPQTGAGLKGQSNTSANELGLGSTITAAATPANDSVMPTVAAPQPMATTTGGAPIHGSASTGSVSTGSVSGSASTGSSARPASQFDVTAISDTDANADSVMENAANGTVVGVTAFASDGDGTDSVTYSLSNDAGGRFTIDGSTGVVTVDGVIDREAAADYTIEVTATSTDGSTSTQSYTIAIGDQDEFDVSAVTDSDAGADTLAENATVGTTVGVVASASDGDATDGVSYAVDDARFTVDPDGTVRVASGASFDHETEASIDITVTATSTDGSTSQQTFTLAVTDVNESGVGAISDTDANADSVMENAANGTVVGVTAFASDGDATDSVTYSLSDDAGGRFTIDGSTGVVTVDGVIDREAAADYTIEVTATSTDGSTSTQSYTIAIGDQDEFDVTAVTDSDAGANTLAENASVGTTVGVVASASDADATDSVSYSVDDNRFTVDPDGTVRVASGASFDHETEASIDITVTATSDDGSTSNETFTLAVTDVNETPTDLTISSNAVAENSAEGVAVGTVSTTDQDVGDSFTYTLLDDAGGRFAIDPNTGQVTVADRIDTSILLDAEVDATHDIVVQVTDSGGNTYSETITINVSDVLNETILGDGADNILTGAGGDDTITGGAGNDILEGGSGTDTAVFSGDLNDFTVAWDGSQFTVTDTNTADGLDEGADSISDVETFAFNGVNYTAADLQNYAANAAPTDITFASGGTVGETVTDGGTIAAAFDPSGTTVATLATTDPAGGGSHTYTLINDPSGKFEIVGNEVRVLPGQTINYETDTSFDLSIRTTDQWGETFDKSLTINVGDYEGAYTAGDGGETITGTAEEDTLTGGTGNDTIDGGDGDDTVVYSDALFDKELVLTAGGDFQVHDRDSTNGDTGDDTLANVETIQFSDRTINVADIQFVNGGAGFTGGAGDDIIVNDETVSAINGGDGNDIIYMGSGFGGSYSGGDGDDVFVQGSGFTLNVYGGAGTDIYYGGEAGDLGAYVYFNDGVGDSDVIYGNASDYLYAYLDADDRIFGNANSDEEVYWYGDGNDHTLTYGVEFSDIDYIQFQAGTSAFTVDASAAQEAMTIGFNGTGDDVYTASDLGDSVVMGSGNDTFNGGDGNDSVRGGDDNDILIGGAGNDTLRGENGDDRFLYAAGDGSDDVFGGAAGGWTDLIELQGKDGAVNISGNTVTGQGWTLVVETGTIDGQSGETLDLSDDAAGTITFDDAATISFTEIEQIVW